ncbi:MAG: hypothetical protein V1863_01880 [Candidatus Omnitrophota bacterium]
MITLDGIFAVINAKVSLDIWSGLIRMSLSSPAAVSFLFFNKQTCNCHKIVGKDGGSYEEFKMLTTLGKTALHAAPAEKNGDMSFNTGAETLSIFEGRAFFIGFLGRFLLASTLRDAYKLDTGVLALPDVICTEKSSIGTVDAGCIAKGFLVTFKRRWHVGFIRGITIEHTILSDQAVGTFGNEDFVAEFYGFQDFASLDQVGMGFKDGKDLLFVWDLLSLDYSPARLVDDQVAEATVVSDLFAKRFDCNLGYQINAMDSLRLLEHLACVFNYLLGDPEEFAIFGRQPVLPLFGCHSLNLLHPASGAAASVGESLDAVRKQLVEISDQPSNDSYAIPEQGTVGWVVNVGFDNGRIDTQFLAIFQAQSNSGFDNDFVDCFKGSWSQFVKSTIKSVMFGNRIAVEMSESSQGIAVRDPFTQFTVIPVFDPHQNKRTQNLRRGHSVAPNLGFLQATLKIAAYLLDQVSVLVDKVGNRLQYRFQAHALAEKFQIGKTDLGNCGSRHFFTF